MSEILASGSRAGVGLMAAGAALALLLIAIIISALVWHWLKGHGPEEWPPK